MLPVTLLGGIGGSLFGPTPASCFRFIWAAIFSLKISSLIFDDKPVRREREVDFDILDPLVLEVVVLRRDDLLLALLRPLLLLDNPGVPGDKKGKSSVGLGV